LPHLAGAATRTVRRRALQNRVPPRGDLVATPERGLAYANRGRLHDDAGRIRRRYATRRWIACRLEFRGWHRSPLMQPGRLTELFILDEATAFAAGHRPCALCRRSDYDRLTAVGRELHPATPAPTRSTPGSTPSGSTAESAACTRFRRGRASRSLIQRSCRSPARPAPTTGSAAEPAHQLARSLR
jgi:hypothetical protein